MNHQSHYRLDDETGCDIAVMDRHLVVNCAGACVMSEPFTSHNRRGRNDYYLMHLIQGSLEMDLRGSVRTLGSGDLVIFPPGCAYRYVKGHREPLSYLWVHFSGTGVPDLLAGCQLETDTQIHPGVSNEITEGFRLLFRNFINRDACFEAAPSAQLAILCVLFGRSLMGRGGPDGLYPTDRLSRSLEHMHRHYHEDLSVRTLAEIEHLSVSRYCAVFKECTGLSPQNFLIDLRLKTASELMLGTDLSVKQIARTVGYLDPLYFSRLFKERKGVSPLGYKEGSRGMEESPA